MSLRYRPQSSLIRAVPSDNYGDVGRNAGFDRNVEPFIWNKPRGTEDEAVGKLRQKFAFVVSECFLLIRAELRYPDWRIDHSTVASPYSGHALCDKGAIHRDRVCLLRPATVEFLERLGGCTRYRAVATQVKLRSPDIPGRSVGVNKLRCISSGTSESRVMREEM